jgi:hypothetical protein
MQVLTKDRLEEIGTWHNIFLENPSRCLAQETRVSSVLYFWKWTVCMYVCMNDSWLENKFTSSMFFGFFIFMCNINSIDVSQLQSHYISTFAVEEHIMLAKLFCSMLIEECVLCYQPLCQNCFIMWSYVYLWSPGHQDFALALETGDNCWVLNFCDLVPIIVGPLVMKLYTMWTYFLVPSLIWMGPVIKTNIFSVCCNLGMFYVYCVRL